MQKQIGVKFILYPDNFFNRPKAEVMAEYKRIISSYLGSHLPNYEHIEKLHDLGYLPIKIKALPEGSKVPMRVPCITILNTLPEFKRYVWNSNEGNSCYYQ